MGTSNQITSPALQQIQEMGISVVSSDTPATIESGYPVANDWSALQTAIQHDDIPGAQFAFANLQKDLKHSPVQSPVPSTAISQCFRTLENSLLKGSSFSSKIAFAALDAAIHGNPRLLPSPASRNTPVAASDSAPLKPVVPNLGTALNTQA